MTNTWGDQSPESMEVFFRFYQDLIKTVPIEEKWFQLIYLAIQTSRFAKDSVVAHTEFAKKAGATRDEVKGAILTTLLAVGCKGVTECLEAALDAYDNA